MATVTASGGRPLTGIGRWA